MNRDGYLTISVDDGHPFDCKTVDLLNKYGLKATFYIPKTNPEREVMSESDVKMIARDFEIGGHTYNHKPLSKLTGNEIEKELKDGKDWMEQLLRKEVVAFCYPRGKFNARVINAVRNTGFKGARTCMYNLNAFANDPFLWGVSTHAYSHSAAVQIRHALLERNFKGVVDFFRVHKAHVDWIDHFKAAVEHVEKNGGVAHLYFHSWEIDELNAWTKLEDLFRYLSGKKGLIRLTNGELFTIKDH